MFVKFFRGGERKNEGMPRRAGHTALCQKRGFAPGPAAQMCVPRNPRTGARPIPVHTLSVPARVPPGFPPFLPRSARRKVPPFPPPDPRFWNRKNRKAGPKGPIKAEKYRFIMPPSLREKPVFHLLHHGAEEHISIQLGFSRRYALIC